MSTWGLEGQVLSKSRRLGIALGLGLLTLVYLQILHLRLDREPVLAARTDAEGTTDVVETPYRIVPDSMEVRRFVEELSARLFAWDDETLESHRAYVKDRMRGRVWQDLPRRVPGWEQAERKGMSGRVDATAIEVTRVVPLAGGVPEDSFGGEEPLSPLPRREHLELLARMLRTLAEGAADPAGALEEARELAPGGDLEAMAVLTEELSRAGRWVERDGSVSREHAVEVLITLEFMGGYVSPGGGLKLDGPWPRERYGFVLVLEADDRTAANPSGLWVKELSKVSLDG